MSTLEQAGHGADDGSAAFIDQAKDWGTARLYEAALLFSMGAVVLSGCGGNTNTTPPEQTYPSDQALIEMTLDDIARLGLSTDDGCSALVLEQRGRPVAALTANHCIDVPPGTPPKDLPRDPTVGRWLLGGNGKYYVVANDDNEIVQTGSNSNAMYTVGIVSEALVSTNGDTDQALLVLQGSTEAEALQAYNQAVAATEHLRTLHQGDIVHVSGWPLKQNGDANGNLIRQDFSATFLDYGTLQLDDGKTVDVAWLVFPPNNNGATCFYGLSGAAAFVPVQTSAGVQREILGTVQGSGPEDGDIGSIAPPNFVHKYPNFPWQNYIGGDICAVTQTPLRLSDMTGLHVVTSEAGIPGDPITPTPPKP